MKRRVRAPAASASPPSGSQPRATSLARTPNGNHKAKPKPVSKP